MEYDRDNAMAQLAKQINAECNKAIEQSADKKDITKITFPVFQRFQQKVKDIGCTITEVKYRMAILNGVIREK